MGSTFSDMFVQRLLYEAPGILVWLAALIIACNVLRGHSPAFTLMIVGTCILVVTPLVWSYTYAYLWNKNIGPEHYGLSAWFSRQVKVLGWVSNICKAIGGGFVAGAVFSGRQRSDTGLPGQYPPPVPQGPGRY